MNALRIPQGLRIAHLIETSGPGGAERIVAEIATALQAAGAENVVFMPDGHEPWLADQLRGTGVAVQTFRIDRPLSPGSLRRLLIAFRKHRIAVAHSHEFSMAVYGGWAAKLAGIPHVVTMHGGRYYALRWRRRLAMRVAVSISGRTVAVSGALGRAMRQDLLLRKTSVRVIPNGVRNPPPQAVTLRRELGLHPSDTLLVAVGNLYPVKGHRHLIDAAAALVGRHPGLHAAVAGRGPLEADLRAHADRCGIGPRIHLLGLRSDVAAVLAAADIVVHPSLDEGLPLAVLEAMVAGRPIVATGVGEIPVVLAHGDAGVLVPPADSPALAEALDGLLREADRRRALGARAAERARREYGLGLMVRRYASIYRALLRRRAARGPRFVVPGAAAPGGQLAHRSAR
ncbi:MAG: glycosyltransferase [Acidobacteria bacterium]|nr:glycosyltransferase [Acidobacteriota bacterium]